MVLTLTLWSCSMIFPHEIAGQCYCWSRRPIRLVRLQSTPQGHCMVCPTWYGKKWDNYHHMDMIWHIITGNIVQLSRLRTTVHSGSWGEASSPKTSLRRELLGLVGEASAQWGTWRWPVRQGARMAAGLSALEAWIVGWAICPYFRSLILTYFWEKQGKDNSLQNRCWDREYTQINDIYIYILIYVIYDRLLFT